MVEIVPAVIPTSLKHLRETLEKFKGLVPIAQIDSVDGVFAKPSSWPYTKGGMEEFRTIAKEEVGLPHWQDLDFEIDLMVSSPEEAVEDWIQVGASRIIVHIESTKNFKNIIRDVAMHVTRAEDDDIKVVSLGLSLNTTTPLEDIEPYIDDVDFVQCMGVATIGSQGQPFDRRALDQIAQLRARHPELIISIDGSVNLDTAEDLIDAGVNRLVVGSAILKSGDVEGAIEEFKALGE